MELSPSYSLSQLCFLNPSKYKFEHPRFCFERLEYVGQKIQVNLPSFLFLLYMKFASVIINIWKILQTKEEKETLICSVMIVLGHSK